MLSSSRPTGRPTVVSGAAAVMTTVPALRIAANAAATSWPVGTPMQTIAESAPCPLVNERARSAASSTAANASVAPSSSDLVRFSWIGSTAMIRPAPAWRAP
jgi:hypothetical protein